MLERSQATKDVLTQVITEIETKLQLDGHKKNQFDGKQIFPPPGSQISSAQYRVFIANADAELLDELVKLLEYLTVS